MANPLFYDRVMETSTTTGTSDWVLAGAVLGYQAFSVRVPTASVIYYSSWAVDANGVPSGKWETGVGVYTLATPGISRLVVLDSSAGAGVKETFAAGTKRIAFALVGAAAVTTSATTASDAPIFGTIESKGYLRIKGPGPWTDVTSGQFTRKCIASQATTTGTIGSGSNALTLAAASDFVTGHGVYVVLDNGTVFTSYITAGGGTTSLTLNDNAPSAATVKEVGHDNTLAIQDAIDFVGTNGVVYFPPGIYQMRQIKLRQGITIKGASPGSTYLWSIPGNTSTGMVILNSDVTDTSIQDFVIYGNYNGTVASTCPGIYLNNTTIVSKKHVLRDVRVVSCGGHGISMTYAFGCNFTDVSIGGCQGHGMLDDANSFFNRFSHIEIDSCGLNGWHMFGSGYTASNAYINGNGVVNAVSYGDNIHFDDNSHGHNFSNIWMSGGLRSNLYVDSTSATGGMMRLSGTSHQNNAAEHVHFKSGGQFTLLLSIVAGTSRLATSLLNMEGSIRNHIEIDYCSTGLGANELAANAPPAIGTALSGSDNSIAIRDGTYLGTGDINVFESEPLLVTRDWTRVSPSTLWRYPGSSVIRIAS